MLVEGEGNTFQMLLTVAIKNIEWIDDHDYEMWTFTFDGLDLVDS